MVGIGNQYANGFKPSHRSKCFIEVNPFNLSVTLSHETSLVSDDLYYPEGAYYYVEAADDQE